MSLIIKGMDMPKNGEITIAFASDENGKNTITLILDSNGNPIEHKGVVEIPTPHGKVIDGDKLVISALEACNRGDDTSIVELIEKLPAIIEVEELNENS